MPFEDFREFLSLLKTESELAEIKTKISSHTYEVSAILQTLPKVQGKAVIFENLEGYTIPMAANIFGTMRRIALALETTEQRLFSEVGRRMLAKWLPPRHVSDGACKEVVIKDDDVDLRKYPILKWNPLDAAPYVTFGIMITRDPETGEGNAGIYRLMLQGKNQVGVNISEIRHATAHLMKAEAKGKPLEAAVVISVDPVVALAAAAEPRLGEDELALAGALRQKPIEVTQCETINVDVPASAEIVLEGIISPNIRVPEGPFGESTGHYGPQMLKPVFKVKAITHREKPIYQATYTGKPPKEEHYMVAAMALPRQKPMTASEAFTRAWRRINKQFDLIMHQKPMRLPKEDVNRVNNKWRSYGLDS